MSRPERPRGSAKADLEAAEWLVRRDRGFDVREEDEFLQWLAADARNGEAFDRQRGTWNEFDRLRELRGAGEPEADLFAPPRQPVRWLWVAGLAAAAGVALALALWRPWSRPGAVLIASAPAGEHRVLSDGSIVDLDPGAALEVRFQAGERHVRLLRGEAEFDVARDLARPFYVHAGGVSIRVIGTAFAVRLAATTVEVLVTEGRVQVDAPSAGSGAAATVLGAGYKMVVSLSPASSAPQVVAVSQAEIALPPVDRPVVLEFSSTRLCDVVAEFNRRNRVQLLIADPELRPLPIVASFRSNNVEGFVRLLEVTAGVRAERSGDTIILRRAH